ncbi:hypothetical protein B0H14DRAFT_2585966 [Mycena olivaceomarginata]|nr:hypothetical protein B0H14DRAFT_2585966 [Mycena olivaceomarginata]
MSFGHQMVIRQGQAPRNQPWTGNERGGSSCVGDKNRGHLRRLNDQALRLGVVLPCGDVSTVPHPLRLVGASVARVEHSRVNVRGFIEITGAADLIPFLLPASSLFGESPSLPLFLLPCHWPPWTAPSCLQVPSTTRYNWFVSAPRQLNYLLMAAPPPRLSPRAFAEKNYHAAAQSECGTLETCAIFAGGWRQTRAVLTRATHKYPFNRVKETVFCRIVRRHPKKRMRDRAKTKTKCRSIKGIMMGSRPVPTPLEKG